MDETVKNYLYQNAEKRKIEALKPLQRTHKHTICLEHIQLDDIGSKVKTLLRKFYLVSNNSPAIDL